MLEEKENTSIEDLIEMLQSNINIAKLVREKFSVDDYMRNPEYRESKYKAFMEKNKLSQDAVDVLIIQTIIDQYVEQVIPIGEYDFPKKEIFCNDEIEKVITGILSMVLYRGNSIIKGDTQSKVALILESGFVTKYKESERRTHFEKRIQVRINRVHTAGEIGNIYTSGKRATEPDEFAR